jgi:hypothetical protein
MSKNHATLYGINNFLNVVMKRICMISFKDLVTLIIFQSIKLLTFKQAIKPFKKTRETVKFKGLFLIIQCLKPEI